MEAVAVNRPAKSYQPRHDALIPRSNPEIMLLPFFPECRGQNEYHARTEDMEVTVRFVPDLDRTDTGDDDLDVTIATPEDRKLLNILSGLLARQVRAGSTSHTIDVSVRELLTSLDGPHRKNPGGEDYRRLRERLHRVKQTEVTLSRRQVNGTWDTEEFWWITNLRFESSDKQIGKDTKSISITLNSKAFDMMTKGVGYDTPHEEFLQITSNPTTTWRIYQICLASLIENAGDTTHISINLLHDLIPMQSDVKVFKSRTLRRSLDLISANELMSKHIRLALVKKTQSGFEEIAFSHRTALKNVHIRIEPVDLSSIKLDTLIGSSDAKQEVVTM